MPASAIFVDEAARVKHLLDVCSPTLDQLTLARLIDRGDYDRHLRRARDTYRRRRDRLLGALHERLPELTPEGVAAGMHVLLRLTPGVHDDRVVAEEAERRGVHVVPLSAYQITPSGGGIVIGYGRVHEDAIDTAVSELASALRSAENRSPGA